MSCVVQDCGRTAYAKGLCKAHYSRMRRGASLDSPIRGPDEPVTQEHRARLREAHAGKVRTFLKGDANPFGQDFDILAEVEPHISSDGERLRRFLVRCKCGNEHIKWLSNFREGQKCRACAAPARGVDNPGWKGHGEIGLGQWNRIRAGATGRGLAFTITIEEVWALFLKQERRCALSGVPLEMRQYKRGSSRIQVRWTASLDRIDNQQGYVPGNVQWVHKDVNRLRGTFDISTFKDWCVTIARHTAEAG